MPYKERDPYHRAMRAFLREKAMMASKKTMLSYRYWLEEAGKIVEYRNPHKITLEEMQRIEAEVNGNPSSKAIKCSVIKQFLQSAGNPTATRWKILSRQIKKVDGVFLSETAIEHIRNIARGMGTVYELLFSLGVDNGLRCVDMARLTAKNAEQLLKNGISMIRSKGRAGGKIRPMVLNQMTFGPLMEYMKIRRQLTQAYLCNPENLLVTEHKHKLTSLKEYTIRKYLVKISDASGIYFRPHDLRRTFGHRHWKAGTPIETIAALMGHESIDQTFKAYIGIQLDDMILAQRNLCPSGLSQAKKVT